MPKVSLREKINEFCKECIHDPFLVDPETEQSFTWRQQVTMCTAKKCPLHDVRTTTRVTKRMRGE